MYDNEFYKNLIKPEFTPSSKIFKIIWPILYILMFISLSMVFMSETDLKNWAIGIFISQLLLNVCWSPVFFILKQIKTALLINIILLMNVALMIFIFFNISKIAGLIQIPYFIWLCFAVILNIEFIKLNPQIDE